MGIFWYKVWKDSEKSALTPSKRNSSKKFLILIIKYFMTFPMNINSRILKTRWKDWNILTMILHAIEIQWCLCAGGIIPFVRTCRQLIHTQWVTTIWFSRIPVLITENMIIHPQPDPIHWFLCTKPVVCIAICISETGKYRSSIFWFDGNQNIFTFWWSKSKVFLHYPLKYSHTYILLFINVLAASVSIIGSCIPIPSQKAFADAQLCPVCRPLAQESGYS